MIGKMAISKAGHDKDEIYVVVGADDKYVYLCDGRLKPLGSPKKKSKKHIQIIKNGIDRELEQCLKDGSTVYDEQIKRAIKEFHRNSKEEKDV